MCGPMDITNRIMLMRVDASSSSGAGHLMRCLALSQAWHDLRGRCCYACCDIPRVMRSILQDEGIDVHELAAAAGSPDDAFLTGELAGETGARALILDGYAFDSAYQHLLVNEHYPVLSIDDCGQIGRHEADIVLDQNLCADTITYENCPSGTRLLLGTQYVLLRREFRQRGRSDRIESPGRKRVLVTMGGSDPANSTTAVLRALDRPGSEQREVIAVIGGMNEFQDELRSAVTQDRGNIQLVHNVTDMSTYMDWADIAITSGGSTCWELAFMGLPSVTLTQAENQRLTAERLHAAGVTRYLGSVEECEGELIAGAVDEMLSSPDQRDDMSRKGRLLVDGQGVDRVITELCQLMERS
ncbi:UDP-2,4-diacetamido-2,4,6-trideoxy-beta-L-altropyranose hydrolase [Candidatus Zixiibacteriota bacterium]